MSLQTKHIYEFGPFRLDAAEHLLLRDGEAVPLTPKAFDLLLALVERHGHLLEKDELLKLVWPDTFVEEANLSSNISLLRKALGDGENGDRYIETMPKRGYRFVAGVKEVAVERAEPIIQELPELQDVAEAKEPVADSAQGRLRKSKQSILLVLAILIVAGAGIGLYKLLGPRRPIAPIQAQEIRWLTQTGKATRAAISPDGKYVAYVLEDAGRQSLWLRHVATKSDTQIAPPAEANYRCITFSPDGNFIYYVRGKPRDPTGELLDISGVLYKTTILGKDEKKLTEKVHNSISLSPDGKLLAFVRPYPSEKRSALIVANIDGTGEKELATRQGLGAFAPYGGLAWSPDGKIIACSTMNTTPMYRNVVGVRVADGVEIPITSHKWGGTITQVTWLPDGSGLLVVGVERFGLSRLIWRLSYPGDKVQKLTNDLSDYADLSLTADSGTLATVRSDRLINIWIAPGGDASRVKQLTSGAGRADGDKGLAWTPDGKIVYRSMVGAAPNVWIMEPDGTGNKQLSFNDPANFNPAVSPDGRHIVWSAGPIRHIWRMDIDGGNPKQLTKGSGEWDPQYSPDGQWLVYRSASNVVWKMPADGGTPVQLTSKVSSYPSISPDGKLIAFNLLDETGVQCKIAVMPFEGGEPIKVFDIPGGFFRPIGWTPDGRAVAYPVYRGGATNIWAQPLDGSQPKQLTDFRDGLIFNFAWSRDGKQLALSRGLINSDVVLISNFR
jgi:Tol biopolymer transport system component/DNA-binding winged helix-turn-helix (wHTH) protein